MIPIFAKKGELRIRQDMLRGVYEENLLMLGRGRPTLSRRRPSALKRILLSTLVCLLGIFVHGQYTSTSLSPSELPANMATFMGPSRFSPPATGISSQGMANTFELNDFVSSGNLPLSRMFGLQIRTIMIDAGHGGADSGSVGKMGTMEKDITLDIAKKLKTHLVKIGRFHVLMTREDDLSVPLYKRVALAQEAKADLFISIHLNYLPRKPINFIETYYFGPSNDEKTLRLAKQENANSEYGLSDFKEIMEKLGKTMKLQESKELAKSIQANLFVNSRKHSGDIKDYGVKRAPFVVLLGVDVPAVLAEVSCLSNSEEERELSSASHRENIAGYLAAGIFDYLNKGAITYEAKK
jgi:N-acetylmuramoyl-L-alanine amidase